MLTIAECRAYINDTPITDQEVEKVRNNLYVLARIVLDSPPRKYENERISQTL